MEPSFNRIGAKTARLLLAPVPGGGFCRGLLPYLHPERPRGRGLRALENKRVIFAAMPLITQGARPLTVGEDNVS